MLIGKIENEMLSILLYVYMLLYIIYIYIIYVSLCSMNIYSIIL